MRPLVTIGIPNFNYNKYLRACIESAVAQIGNDVEILISDNCSTDGSWQTITSFADSRIRAWRQPGNIGMFANWNFLLGNARGEYFKLLQSDDLVTDRFVVALRNLLERASMTSRPAVVVHGFSYVTQSGATSGSYAPSSAGLPNGMIVNDRSTSLFQKLAEFGQPTLNVLRTDLAVAAGGYIPEDSMRADYLVLFRVLAAPESLVVGVSDEVVGVQRFHGENSRTRFSAIASIRDELAAAKIVEGATSPSDLGRVRRWKGKVAAHAVLHCAYSLIRRRDVTEAHKVLANLNEEKVLATGVLLAPLYAFLFGLLRLFPARDRGPLGKLRRFLRQ